MRLMFDQIIVNKNYELAKYILHRTGDELLNKKDIPKKEITFDKLKNKLLYYLKVVKYLVPKTIRENVFVETSIGERHLWMYDSYSISKKVECPLIENPKKVRQLTLNIINGKESSFSLGEIVWTNISIYLWEKAVIKGWRNYLQGG